MNKPCSDCPNAVRLEGRKKVRFVCKDWERKAHCDEFTRYQDWLESRRLYRKGPPIKSFDEFLSYDLVWMFGKPLPQAVAANASVYTVKRMIEAGTVCRCIRKSN